MIYKSLITTKKINQQNNNKSDCIKKKQNIESKCSHLFVPKFIQFPLIKQNNNKNSLFIDYKIIKLEKTDRNMQLLKKIAQQEYKKQLEQQAKKKKQQNKKQDKKQQKKKENKYQKDILCEYCNKKFKESQIDNHYSKCPQKRRHLFIDSLKSNHRPTTVIPQVQIAPSLSTNMPNNSQIPANNNGSVNFTMLNQNYNNRNSNAQNNSNNYGLNQFLRDYMGFMNLNNNNNRNNQQQNDNQQDEQISSPSQSQQSQQNQIEEIQQIEQNNKLKVVQGYSLKKLKRLKAIEYKPQQNNQTTQCNICSHPLVVKQKIVALKCQHSYHFDCIKLWLEINKSCPTCNQKIQKNEIFY